MTAIFALPGRITVRTRKICWNLCGRFLGIARTEGVLYSLAKERNVNVVRPRTRILAIQIDTVVVFNLQRL